MTQQEQIQQEELYQQAMACETGNNDKPDYQTAESLYRQAARKGHAPSQFALGVLCAKGLGQEADMDEAFLWWKKAAKNGHHQAQYNLGIIYLQGELVTRDVDESIRWMKMAANGGHVLAQFHLGREYYEGKNIRYDFQEAMHWIGKAARQGFAAAQCDLGQLYVTGQGIGRTDYVEAYAWVTCARENGYKPAERVLKAMEKNLGLTGNQIRTARSQGERYRKSFTPQAGNTLQNAV